MDMPTLALQGWVSPNQHNMTVIDGQPHHVVVQPDPSASVVNRLGNHSIRGGTLALKVHNPDGPTADRLKTPLLRVNGQLTPVSWDDAFEIMARVSRHVLDNYGEAAWAMKTFSYQYFENTYAISKLAFRSIGTPAYSPHDKPGPGADGELVGTKRLHDSTLELSAPQGPTVHRKWLTHFSTHSGKAVLNKSPWEWFSDFYERITPKGDELWLTNGRMNEVWQSAYDDSRKPYISQRWPTTHVEIHPEDARPRGIESGGEVLMENDDILIQTGGFSLVKGDEFLFSKLEENGLIRRGRGRSKGVAIVTDAVRPGVLYTNFLWAPDWPDTESNSLVHRVPDPITNRYRFKLDKANIRKIGETPYKDSFKFMSFKSRNIV